MIGGLDELVRWDRTPLATGGVILTAPTTGASLRIHPQQRPLRSLHEIASRLHDGTPLGPIRRIRTVSGEPAAMMSLGLGLDGVPYTRAIGMLVRDAEYALIEGMAPEPAIADLVECVVRTCVSPAAHERARMFAYRAPERWLGVRRPLATCWLAPRYPRERARIVVCDAVPIASAVTQDLLWPFDPAAGTAESLERESLRGTLVCSQTGGTTRALADLRDRRFRYRVQLHDGNDEALAAMRAIVDSIEPIILSQRSVARSSQEAFAWLA